MDPFVTNGALHVTIDEDSSYFNFLRNINDSINNLIKTISFRGINPNINPNNPNINPNNSDFNFKSLQIKEESPSFEIIESKKEKEFFEYIKKIKEQCATSSTKILEKLSNFNKNIIKLDYNTINVETGFSKAINYLYEIDISLSSVKEMGRKGYKLLNLLAKNSIQNLTISEKMHEYLKNIKDNTSTVNNRLKKFITLLYSKNMDYLKTIKNDVELIRKSSLQNEINRTKQNKFILNMILDENFVYGFRRRNWSIYHLNQNYKIEETKNNKKDLGIFYDREEGLIKIFNNTRNKGIYLISDKSFFLEYNSKLEIIFSNSFDNFLQCEQLIGISNFNRKNGIFLRYCSNKLSIILRHDFLDVIIDQEDWFEPCTKLDPMKINTYKIEMNWSRDFFLGIYVYLDKSQKKILLHKFDYLSPIIISMITSNPISFMIHLQNINKKSEESELKKLESYINCRMVNINFWNVPKLRLNMKSINHKAYNREQLKINLLSIKNVFGHEEFININPIEINMIYFQVEGNKPIMIEIIKNMKIPENKFNSIKNSESVQSYTNFKSYKRGPIIMSFPLGKESNKTIKFKKDELILFPEDSISILGKFIGWHGTGSVYSSIVWNES